MREITVSEISGAVARLCIDANVHLNQDLYDKIKEKSLSSSSAVERTLLCQLLENAELAKAEQIPICQDTGMTVCFLEIGQDVHITGGQLDEAVQNGVQKGYGEGFLRKSVVRDPLIRDNTGDNTPAIVYTQIVRGDRVKISVLPKGFGSENMSKIKMLTPADGREGVIDFVVGTVKSAGANPCPPIVVGVGIGGDFEYAAYLSKRALLRRVGEKNQDGVYAFLEEELLKKINETGIGAQGLGGDTTALAVHVEQFATHIAGLPVAVNMSCHVSRHKETVL